MQKALRMDQLSTHDAGIIGGIVTALGGLWHLIRWAVGRKDSQALLREKKLDAWEADLQRRDAEYHEKVENRLQATERKLSAVSAALFTTIAEVQILDAAAPALARAKMILQSAYPVAQEMPDDIAALIHRLG